MCEGLERKIVYAGKFQDTAIVEYFKLSKRKKKAQEHGNNDDFATATTYIAYLPDALLLLSKIVKDKDRWPDAGCVGLRQMRTAFQFSIVRAVD